MQRDRLRRRAAIIERRVRHAIGKGAARQLDDGRTVKTTERVGLGGPIEVAERTREATELMLGRVVIALRY
jgi:hypothetical protein